MLAMLCDASLRGTYQHFLTNSQLDRTPMPWPTYSPCMARLVPHLP